jgi:rSAM/selenodomain-associated transferase 1
MAQGVIPPEVSLAVFARAPVAGEVKTRLAATLGAERAARLHEGLVWRTLGTAAAAQGGPVTLWCSPDCAHPFFERCRAQLGVELRAQRGADLGERMRAAFEDAWAHGRSLVLIGSDCPALAPAHLAEAARRLGALDAVFIPAEDGGYVLVGASRRLPRLFEDIEWGGAGVMAATRRRLGEMGARWEELPTLWDVDRAEDYERMCAQHLLGEAA